MSQSLLKKMIFILIIFPITCIAAVPSWKIVPSESFLSFTATQNDAPITGKFTNFSGEINFDPNQLSESNVKIIVNVGSVAASYNQLSDTLKTPDWFNVKVFPQAIFQSNNFTKTGDKTFQAKGNLTIRDKTLPIILIFSQKYYSQAKAVMKGSAIIKRTAFGVGQGEWSDTKAVRDDVQIDFTVTGVSK